MMLIPNRVREAQDRGPWRDEIQELLAQPQAAQVFDSSDEPMDQSRIRDRVHWVSPRLLKRFNSIKKLMHQSRTRDKVHWVSRPSAEEEMRTSCPALTSQRRCHTGPQCLEAAGATAMGVACA